MTERGPVFDAAQVACDKARAERDHIIDNPDKSVPLDVYKARIRDAQAKVQQADRAVMEAWG